jgi:xanthine dehydrogenase accessory factor
MPLPWIVDFLICGGGLLMTVYKRLDEVVILVRGAGEMATGVAHRLTSCRFRVCLTEAPDPQSVRREVAFSEAVFDREKEVEGITAKRVAVPDQILDVWEEGKIPALVTSLKARWSR